MFYFPCSVSYFRYIVFQINHVDLSPNYAGTMMGITNMFANICGFVTPYVTGAIINENVSFTKVTYLQLADHIFKLS